MGGHCNVSSTLGQTREHLEDHTRSLKSGSKAPLPQALALVWPEALRAEFAHRPRAWIVSLRELSPEPRCTNYPMVGGTQVVPRPSLTTQGCYSLGCGRVYSSSTWNLLWQPTLPKTGLFSYKMRDFIFFAEN